MDKVKVNNQVVSMRKFVKQAKIHVINKCTKQIKFLENRKGNEEQVSKTKRKLQRLLEEVNILKKIKPDTVSKLALTKEKDWKAVLAEKNVPLEERCFAMLANHAPVQEAVEKFHGDNAALISKLPELVKEWEKRGSKAAERFKKKQNKDRPKNSDDPNTIPIESKNFQKYNKTQISHQSTESLENPPHCPNTENGLSNITDEKLATEENTEDEESSENDSDSVDPAGILSSPAESKVLAIDEAKDENSCDPLPNSSEVMSHQSSLIKEVLPVKDKQKSIESFKHTNQSRHSVNRQNNLTKKKVPLKKEAMESNATKLESTEEESSGKSQDIRSKLLEISRAKSQVQNKSKNRSSINFGKLNKDQEIDSDESSLDSHRNLSNTANISNTETKLSLPIKPEVKNKIKAVTMLNLDELQDVDEIPIDRSESDSEDDESDEDVGKQKKDPFFLRDGEAVSESDEDNDDKKEITRKHSLPFKKMPYGNYNTGVQRDNSFQKRKFEKHSKNGNFSPFKKKQYDNSNNREQKDSSFQKMKFDRHSANERNSNFRDNSYVKNRKGLSFKDNKPNFKRTFNDDSDHKQNKKFKFASPDKFRNRSDSNNLAKRSNKTPLSQNHSKNSKGNSYNSKPNLNNPQKIDDNKPLHPSWEAKKKLKEPVNVKFQGKRMVFND